MVASVRNPTIDGDLVQWSVRDNYQGALVGKAHKSKFVPDIFSQSVHFQEHWCI